MDKRRNFSSGAISPLFHNIFNISLTSGVKLHILFMKFGCKIYLFLNSSNLICRGTDISKYFRESDFEITRVDCTVFFRVFLLLWRFPEVCKQVKPYVSEGHVQTVMGECDIAMP